MLGSSKYESIMLWSHLVSLENGFEIRDLTEVVSAVNEFVNIVRWAKIVDSYISVSPVWHALHPLFRAAVARRECNRNNALTGGEDRPVLRSTLPNGRPF